MRFITSLALSVSMLAAPAVLAADAKSYADVEIKLDDAKLGTKTAGIRTLYITIYDAATEIARPYGAVKVDLTKDAKGTVYTGKLDSSNVMKMGGGEAPKKLRIKARLDKDGSAGPDAPGDLVGIVENVALGSKTTVTIDKAL